MMRQKKKFETNFATICCWNNVSCVQHERERDREVEKKNVQIEMAYIFFVHRAENLHKRTKNSYFNLVGIVCRSFVFI